MAYVALSRVRTLEGVHLIIFDKDSIIVSGDCLNRLRKQYTPQLQIYSIPQNAKYHKLTGYLMLNEPAIKQPKKKKYIKKQAKRSLKSDMHKAAKKALIADSEVADDGCNPSEKVRFASKDDDLVITRVSNQPNLVRHNFVYYPANAATQKYWCGLLALKYVKAVRPCPGTPSTPLTHPSRIVNVQGDGNCLFRAFSYIITGSQNQYKNVRAAIVAILKTVLDMVCLALVAMLEPT